MNKIFQEFADNFINDEEKFINALEAMITQTQNSYYLVYQLLSSMPGSILLIGQDNKVIAASPKMLDKFLQSEDVTGIPYDQLDYSFFKKKSKKELVINLIRQSLAKDINLEKVLIEDSDKGDHPTMVEMNLQILYNQSGQKIGALVNLVEDIIRQNMLPGNLEKDQKLKKLGSLSAGLVHEIKNPMQSIYSILQLLQHKYPDDKFIQNYLDSAMTEVHTISAILSEFLIFSGNNQEFMRFTHINDICEDVLKILEGNCYMNEIELQTNLSEDVPEMFLDVGRIKQVIVNLVTNSVDAINTLRNTDDFAETHPDHQGSITVSTEYNYDQNECYLRVEDNGIGMTEETLANIARPFYTTKKYGTGIGVSISKNIIKNHGGRIDIQSQYGQGSAFTLILPELAGQMSKVVKRKDGEPARAITVTNGDQYLPEDY